MRIYSSILRIFALSILMCVQLCAANNACQNCDATDLDQVLTISHILNVQPSLPPGSSVDIVPYLTKPDNSSIVLPTLHVTSGGLFPIEITLPNPEFGTYRFVYMIQAVNAAGTVMSFTQSPVKIDGTRYIRPFNVNFPITESFVIPTPNQYLLNMEATFQYTRLLLPE